MSRATKAGTGRGWGCSVKLYLAAVEAEARRARTKNGGTSDFFVGVVCELDSVFLFVFVFLSFFVGVFWLGLPLLFGGLFSDIFLLESLILAQDERWRRA